jgi:hypothetical protein
MATEFCEKCKQSHPGRVCDYDDKGECSETADGDEKQQSSTRTRTDPKAESPNR